MIDLARQSVDSISDAGAITREQAAAIPYASIGVRIGSSREVLLALATQSRHICLWTSAAHIAIETQYGRVTRSAGLPHDMSQTPFSGMDPLRTGTTGNDLSCDYRVDLPDISIYQATTRYVTDAPQADEIVILGAKRSLLHWRERGTCPALGWEFENEYWVDSGSDFVWRSKQTIHPDMDRIEITVLRPPA